MNASSLPLAAAPPPAPAVFNLTRRFSLLALACVAVVAAALGFVLARMVSERLLHRDATVSMEFVQSIVRTDQTAHYFERAGSIGAPDTSPPAGGQAGVAPVGRGGVDWRDIRSSIRACARARIIRSIRDMIAQNAIAISKTIRNRVMLAVVVVVVVVVVRARAPARPRRQHCSIKNNVPGRPAD